MPADLIDQLELVGRVLDRVAPPLTIDEITEPGHVAETTTFIEPQPLEVQLAVAPAPTRDRRLAVLLGVAATVVMIVGLVALAGRDHGPVAAPTDTAASTPSGTTSVTVPSSVDSTPSLTAPDPLTGLDLADGSVPTDAVFRFSESLGEFGQVWVYDSASTERVYVARRGALGNSFGYFDLGTYESSQAWSQEGLPGGGVLYGFTPPSAPVTVTIGAITVNSDSNGLWYTAVPADAASFTITTPNDTHTFDLATSNNGLSTTTVFVTEPATAEPDPVEFTGARIGDDVDSNGALDPIDPANPPAWISVADKNSKVVGYLHRGRWRPSPISLESCRWASAGPTEQTA